MHPAKFRRGLATRPKNNSPNRRPSRHRFVSICIFSPTVMVELGRILSPARQEDNVPTPATTDYRSLCRILGKRADNPNIGSALALTHNRCRLYVLGALGSPAFLDGQCGLSKSFARRFISHCRSLIRSGNHLPRPYVRKNKTPPAAKLRAFHAAFTHSVRGSARSPGGIVGSRQPGVGCLSDLSKHLPDGSGHHGDNNQNSDVEDCDGWRRAH